MIEYQGPVDRPKSPMKRPSTIKHRDSDGNYYYEDSNNELSKPPMTGQRSSSVISKRSYVRNRIDPVYIYIFHLFILYRICSNHKSQRNQDL